MENKKMIFKTNLNCQNCVSKVQDDFNNSQEIAKWEVNTNHLDKILTIEGDISSDKVIQIVKNKGFTIEEII